MAAMSNRNSLLSQTLCHCRNEGRTLKDISLNYCAESVRILAAMVTTITIYVGVMS